MPLFLEFKHDCFVINFEHIPLFNFWHWIEKINVKEMTVVGFSIAFAIAAVGAFYAIFILESDMLYDFLSIDNLIKSQDKLQGDPSVESVVANAWSIIVQPETSEKFQHIAVGVNGNVDLIVKGSDLLMKLDETSNSSSTKPVDHDVLQSLQDLQETYKYFFSKGAGGERFFMQRVIFHEILAAAKIVPDIEFFIGGNAALIAQKLAAMTSDDGKVLLCVPLGPKLETVLHPLLVTPDNSAIDDDEYHLILEYGKDESWSGARAPIASRFIFSHDQSNARMAAIEPLMQSLKDFHPDLLVLSGFHLLEINHVTFWKRRISEIATLISPLARTTAIHVELAAMVDEDCLGHILQQIVPRVDSIGLNEQELWMVCRIGGGPHCNDKGLDGPPSIAIASDILHWMLDVLGRAGGSRLTRIHFHTLTYHMAVVADPSPWRNQASAVLAGTRIAATQACDDLDQVRPEKLELRVTGEVRLSMLSNDEKFTRTFDPGRPVMTWHRPEMTFHLSPVLVCRKPVKTVGLGDAISATGLYYSGFER